MTELGIDIETYSSVSLKTQGVHKYVASDDFEILLLAYSLDHQEVECIDIASGEEVPVWLINALTDPNVLKTAHNAKFEIACLNWWWDLKMDVSQWDCTMIKSAMLGYPLSLDQVAKAMGLTEQKDREGKALIRYFTVPNKGVRKLPAHDPGKWARFKAYNINDVVVEQAIRRQHDFFKIPKTERDIWVLDQKINNVGVMLDLQLVEQAIALNKINSERLLIEAVGLTSLANPNSPKQLKEWLTTEMDTPVNSLTKENVKELIGDNNDETVGRVLEIRQELAKSSIKKYKAMLEYVDDKHRAKDLFQLWGAQKTGRWSGRGIQLQNLTKTMEDLDRARAILKTGNLELLEMLYGNLSNTLSGLIRTAIVAGPGKELGISDFSAIEARVLAWFAQEIWRLKVFQGDGKIYEASGAHMFKIPASEVVGNIRFKAKTAELALGYQGGVGAIVRMETMGLKTGLLPEERQPLVNTWRAANPRIVRFWYDLERAALLAVESPGRTYKMFGLVFGVKHNTLFIKLPSGRYLSYVKPFIKNNSFDRPAVHYWGIDQDTKQWTVQDTYGGKLAENVVQGTARDLLADTMLRLDKLGWCIVGHVHDEIITEITESDQRGEDNPYAGALNTVMSAPVSWAPGLPLAAVTTVSPFYLKD